MSETQELTGSLQDLAGLAPAAQAAPVYEVKRDAQGRSYATGRRKDAVARVWISLAVARSLLMVAR